MAARAQAPSLARRVEKSPAAFRTISEVAAELGVAQHVLRFWESKFSQVRPLKRGGGRRYYRPEDVELLRSLKFLLYVEGYTIRGVQKLLRDGALKAGRAASVVDGPGAGAPAREGAGTALSAAQRAALQAVVEDLIALRKMLRRRL
ncbi:MAG: MerR family transcriptional regulator [Alphaproteobacteria bacterium]